ncbi:hypothetical protein [Nocardioides sambongensis]|uniref:hypothetical protein n=1 Tax=Nocardioides sambongensis TaxID=2589074 RepID=UPI001E4D47E6|nr:hypothetical protein [Nocardioides sambongensis]
MGPDDPIAGLHWWAHRVRLADKARRLCASPFLSVRLEDLATQGEQSHWAAALADHVGVPVEEMEAAMATFSPDVVKSGGWRESIRARRQARIDATYRDLWIELRDEGVEGLPAAPDQAG